MGITSPTGSGKAGLFRFTELSLLSPTAGIDAKPRVDAPARLAELVLQVQRDLRYLDYPAQHWVNARQSDSGEHIWDVVVVGAGQGGLALTFGLKRQKIDNVIALDRAPAGREGPWITYARMLTLRSAKHVTGPDLGIGSLTPQAWYVAVYGEEAWHQLGKWPRAVWQDYLIWYRHTLALPVRNGVEITGLVPEGELVRVMGHDLASQASCSWLARKVVLSTGIEGNGAWQLPDRLLDAIPADRYMHTNWEYDLAHLKGKRVAVLGAGASAFDTAATVLELGAASVHQFVRRKAVPNVNPFRLMERAGFLHHFADMSDAERWRWMMAITKNGQPPTQDGVNRCTAFSTYALTTGETWQDMRIVDDDIEITTSRGARHRFDFLILGTGYTVDLSQRSELASFADKIALWRDVFKPAVAEQDHPVSSYPYLSSDLSFREKVPGTAPYLKNIHNFTYMATASVGYSGASLTGMKYGIQRLLDGITSFLWLHEAPYYLGEIEAYGDIDLNTTGLVSAAQRAESSDRQDAASHTTSLRPRQPTVSEVHGEAAE
jgi:cation diffusion facilitator CzcD-associated flavoprotein CzcO